VEVSGHYSAVSFADDAESSKVQDNLGLQAAIGVGRLVDMRARYERISVNGEGEGTNVLGIGPKVAFVEDRVAFHLPVGLAFGGGIESSDTWEMHPTILLTAPLDGKLEVNGSAKMLVPLTTGRGDPLVAFNVGLGISSDLTRWALRPEFGVMFNPGESGHFQHVSLGLTIFTGNGE
jgi:hypothetical protein